MAIRNIFSSPKIFKKPPRPKNFEFLTFTWFLCFRIHKSIFLNYFVNLGSLVFILFNIECDRIFFYVQILKKISYFFGNAAIWKLKEILTYSLRHLKAKSIFLKNNDHMVLSTAMPSLEIKSLKRAYIGTKYNIGLISLWRNHLVLCFQHIYETFEKSDTIPNFKQFLKYSMN